MKPLRNKPRDEIERALAIMDAIDLALFARGLDGIPATREPSQSPLSRPVGFDPGRKGAL